MLAEKRHEKIVQITEEMGFVRTRELADRLKVSETTIRRDVEELDARRRLVRVHGGARSLFKGRLTTSQDEARMRERIPLHAREKEAIARRAVTMIKDGDCIFLDGGTTTLPMIALLRDRDVTIVTHSSLAVEEFREGEARLFVLPGDYDVYFSMFTGPVTCEILSRFHFDIAFFSCLGINVQEGTVLASELATPAVKKVARTHSTRNILMADSSKTEIRSLYTMAEISDYDLVITDAGIRDRLKDSQIPDNFLITDREPED